LTSLTLRPAARSERAVPPVEMSATPIASRPLARSISPVLSDTLSSARRTGCGFESCIGMAAGWSADYTRAGPGPRQNGSLADAQRAELLAQCGAVDAERRGSLALVAAGPGQHFAQQRPFDFAEHELVEVFGHLRIQIVQVAAHGACDALSQRRLQGR